MIPTAGHTWRRCWLCWLQGQQLHSSHGQRLLPQPGHARRRVGGQRAGSVQQVPVEGANGCIAVPLGTARAVGVTSRGGGGLVEAAAPLLAGDWAGACGSACSWGSCRPCRELCPCPLAQGSPGDRELAEGALIMQHWMLLSSQPSCCHSAKPDCCLTSQPRCMLALWLMPSHRCRQAAVQRPIRRCSGCAPACAVEQTRLQWARCGSCSSSQLG